MLFVKKMTLVNIKRILNNIEVESKLIHFKYQKTMAINIKFIFTR